MIRPALLSDIAAINGFDTFAGNRILEIADDRMLVAEIAGAVVGYASWLPRGFVRRDYIAFIGVDPVFQRRGLGRALLQAVEVTIGPGRVFTSTDENNAAMIALLPIQGWTYAGSVAGANEGDRAEVFFYKDRARTGDAEPAETN